MVLVLRADLKFYSYAVVLTCEKFTLSWSSAHMYVTIRPEELQMSFLGIFEVYDTIVAVGIWDHHIGYHQGPYSSLNVGMAAQP